MKRIYLLFLILFAVESFGQVVTQFPIIDEQSSNETEITKVELRGEYTIIHFRYQMSKRRGRNYDFSLPNQKQYTTISFNPDGYLNGNGKRFRYIKSTGIVELTDEKSNQKVYPGDVHLFTVYFERLDPGVELFNLIEGKNNPEQNLLFWNFYGIHIKNPLRKSSSMPNAAIILTIKGRLMDAKTQNLLAGK